MSIKLIPNVFQMMFWRKYAKRQLEEMYQERKVQLKEKGLLFEKKVVENARKLFEKGIDTGRYIEDINKTFNIRYQYITALEFRGSGAGKEDNKLIVRFFNTYEQLLKYLTEGSYNYNFGKEKEKPYYWVTKNMKGEVTGEYYELQDFLYAQDLISKKGAGYALSQGFHLKKERMQVINLIKNVNQLKRSIELLKKNKPNPIYKDIESDNVRFYKYVIDKNTGKRVRLQDYYVDIFISNILDTNPPEFTINNVSKDDIIDYNYIKWHVDEMHKSVEKSTKEVIDEFVKPLYEIIRLVDDDVKKEINIYKKRTISKMAKTTKANIVQTYVKKEEAKKRRNEKLLERFRTTIFKIYERTEPKPTFFEVFTKIKNQILELKDLFRETKKELFEIFSKIEFELKNGYTYKRSLVFGLVEVIAPIIENKIEEIEEIEEKEEKVEVKEIYENKLINSIEDIRKKMKGNAFLNDEIVKFLNLEIKDMVKSENKEEDFYYKIIKKIATEMGLENSLI